MATRIKSIALLIAFSTLSILSACNTMEGAGQDMQRAGRSIEKHAQ